MTTIVKEDLDSLIENEWNYIQDNRGEWSLLEGKAVDLEVLEHILRCILHLDNTKEMAQEFRECLKVQNPDGGWSKASDSDKTSIWVTAFVALKLARGNAILNDAAIAGAVDHCLESVLSWQKEDGHWFDDEWSNLDTTCSVTYFLTICQVMNDKLGDERINKARVRGFEYIMSQHRESGLWKDNQFHPSGIETTAHLMQYTLIPAYFMDKIEFAEQSCLDAAEGLLGEQAENGSWDNENTDHTMDALRNLILVGDSFKQRDKYQDAIDRGIRWLIEIKNDKGWGDFPDEPSNIERTADGLDTLLKYKRYLSGKRMSDFWAFTKEN